MGFGSRPTGPSFARVLATVSIIVAVGIIAMVLNAPSASAASSASVNAAGGGGTTLQATISRDDHGIPTSASSPSRM